MHRQIQTGWSGADNQHSLPLVRLGRAIMVAVLDFSAELFVACQLRHDGLVVVAIADHECVECFAARLLGDFVDGGDEPFVAVQRPNTRYHRVEIDVGANFEVVRVQIEELEDLRLRQVGFVAFGNGEVGVAHDFFRQIRSKAIE